MNRTLMNTTDWNDLPFTQHVGETGISQCKSLEANGFKVRLVEYSEDYVGEASGKSGQVIFCIDGELVIDFINHESVSLKKGMSYAIPDSSVLWKFKSRTGVKLMMIEGSHKNRENILNPWRM